MTLTPTQRSLLAAMCVGKTKRQFAAKHGMSYLTTYYHLRTARKDNKASTDEHLCAMFIADELLKDRPPTESLGIWSGLAYNVISI